MRRKIKEFKAVDFCLIASSKDKTRLNLNGVYRDTDRFVGCDGHRLHWVEASKVEKPYYLDGKDAEYPDYHRTIPSDLLTTVYIPQGTNIEPLIALDAALKCLGKIRDVRISGVAGGKALLFSSEYSEYKFEVVIPCEVRRDIEVCVSLHYLIDALSLLDHSQLAISFKSDVSPLQISSEIGAYAVVMPLRNIQGTFKGITTPMKKAA